VANYYLNVFKGKKCQIVALRIVRYNQGIGDEKEGLKINTVTTQGKIHNMFSI
jgi:transposase-like protein